MIFYKEPTGLLNVFNNSIFEFGKGSNATIIIDKYSFTISSDAQNDFYLNLKEIVKAIINESEFNDTTQLIGAVTLDDTLSRSIAVSFTVDNEETITKTLTFLKATAQIEDQPKSDILRPLLPSQTLVYFEGLPFDFSVYSNQDRTISGVELKQGVNRIQLESGSSFFEVFNNGFFATEETNIYSFENLTIKKACKDGEYIKWFSQSGGWCYWQFEKNKIDKYSARPFNTIGKDTSNVEEADKNSSSFGTSGTRSIILNTGLMDVNEQPYFIDYLLSPKRYIWRNDKWIEIKIKRTTANINNTFIKQNFKTEIYLTDNYNQTL